MRHRDSKFGTGISNLENDSGVVIGALCVCVCWWAGVVTFLSKTKLTRWDGGLLKYIHF
jgi:hypothetical protein